jgi:NifU-like protein involved in Fe-S cluster formation
MKEGEKEEKGEEEEEKEEEEKGRPLCHDSVRCYASVDPKSNIPHFACIVTFNVHGEM